MADVQLYDVERALREVARHRSRRDEPSRAAADVADQLAGHMVRHFGPEAVETARLSLVVAAASLAVLAAEDVNPRALVNILAMTGQRLVSDARAADGVISG